MKELRDLIDTSCPVIYAGNWPAENAKGWRWITNLDVSDQEDSEATIQEYQTAHGKKNVCVGHPFNETSLKPAPITKKCGLYVRDVEDLVKQVINDLNSAKNIEQWLNGETK